MFLIYGVKFDQEVNYSDDSTGILMEKKLFTT